jgi:hypothetical protein
VDRCHRNIFWQFSRDNSTRIARGKIRFPFLSFPFPLPSTMIVIKYKQQYTHVHEALKLQDTHKKYHTWYDIKHNVKVSVGYAIFSASSTYYDPVTYSQDCESMTETFSLLT